MRPTMMLLLGTLLAVGCADQRPQTTPLSSRVGQNCAVHYSRDALGMAGDIPSTVEAGNINGAEVTQHGQLMEVGADWVVINYHGREFHIPQSAILFIECGSNITQQPGLSEPLAPKPGEHGGHTHQ